MLANSGLMIEGFIVYSPAHSSQILVRNVVDVRMNIGLLSILIDDGGILTEAFLYDLDKRVWYIPHPNKKEEWKVFDGEVLAFKYIIKLEKKVL